MSETYVRSGFFNSGNGLERKYDATDFSRLFDGLIKDGVFATVPGCFIVTPVSGNTVRIDKGKAWFNHTWTTVDEAFTIECGDADPNDDRYDAIVLEVDSSSSVLNNSIKFKPGTAALNPAKPSLKKGDFVNQYALCYIKRPKGSTSITASNIENVVGKTETPFVTAMLQTVSLDELLGQWEGQLDEFIAEGKAAYGAALSEDRQTFVSNGQNAINGFKTDGNEAIAEFNSTASQKYADYETWSSNLRAQMETILTEAETWSSDLYTTVDDYLTLIKGKLDEDPATSLQSQIDENEIISVLMNGFSDGSKIISGDGTTITSVDSTGRTLTKTFTNEFSTSTTVLKNNIDIELGRLVKTISSDGLTITSEFTLL